MTSRKRKQQRAPLDQPVICPMCGEQHVRRYVNDYACKPCRQRYFLGAPSTTRRELRAMASYLERDFVKA